MVSHIIGNYLVERGILTREQLTAVLKERYRVRAGLGLITVSEGLLTYEEAQEILKAARSDRAFAEEVVERGYLTEGQVRALSRRQGGAYMSFVQALENLGLMNIFQLEEHLKGMRPDFTYVELEDLKSDDVNRIMPLFIPREAAHYVDAACAAARVLIRSVDTKIYPLKAFITKQFDAANGVIQFVEGDKAYSYALVGKGKELAVVASRYMHEQYEEVDEEVMDIIGEILSVISGLYATELSQEELILELLPPRFYGAMKEISAEEMLVLPLVVKNNTFYLLINMNNLVKIQ